jgi:transcriptional regulator with XRE-family HTH domain
MLGMKKLSVTPVVAFGRALRRLRLTAHLTQEQLGLESGVARTFISQIELGQHQPTISTIFRLAEALKVKPSKLVSEAEKIVAGEQEA